jgi:hypothetical protein
MDEQIALARFSEVHDRDEAERFKHHANHRAAGHGDGCRCLPIGLVRATGLS